MIYPQGSCSLQNYVNTALFRCHRHFGHITASPDMQNGRAPSEQVMAQCGCHVTNTRPTWKVSYTDDDLWCYHSHSPTLCYHSHVTNTRPTWKLSYTDDNLWCYHSHDPHSSLPCTHYKSRRYFFTLRSYACSLWLVVPCL